MNLLAIDTSTELATVALSTQGDIVSEEQNSLRQHAQLLLPMIERLLGQTELGFKQLDAIVFGCGPGSFTGLRIACSIAKALAYAHDLPLYPVSSLAAIAHDVFQTELDLLPDTQVLAMIDARMQQAYWAVFTQDSLLVQEKVSAATDIVVSSASPLIVAGVGFEAYAVQLPESIQAQVIKQQTAYPSARAMIQLAESGQFKPVSAAEALPVYVRNQITQGESRG